MKVGQGVTGDLFSWRAATGPMFGFGQCFADNSFGVVADAASLWAGILVAWFALHALKEPFGLPWLLACALALLGILVMKTKR